MRIIFKFTILALISWQSFGQSPVKTETIGVNGIDLYYEVYGEGEPLFLLHGWTQSSQFWSEYIPAYAKHFKVYAIDLRGHGKTSELTNNFTIKKASEDILQLMDKLKIKTIKAIGLSYGGLALLELAVSHPERLESMVLIGVSQNYNGGENTDSDNTFSYENLPSPFIKKLKKTHYRGVSQIKALFNPNLNYEISISNEDLKPLNARALIVNGDRDELLGITPAIVLHENLPNSELWIVPNTGHIAITGVNQDSFLEKSSKFFLKEE